MVRDFIVVHLHCEFCARIYIAAALTQADIDLIDIHSGDPRIKIIEKLFSGGDIYVPTGIVKNTVLNSSRDVHFMYALFGGEI